MLGYFFYKNRIIEWKQYFLQLITEPFWYKYYFNVKTINNLSIYKLKNQFIFNNKAKIKI